METVGSALTVIAGFVGLWFVLHKYARDIRRDIKQDIAAAKQDLVDRMDQSEVANRAGHAALAAQRKAQGEELKAQGKALTDMRVEVGRLSGFTGQALVEALRRLVGDKDSSGPQD